MKYNKRIFKALGATLLTMGALTLGERASAQLTVMDNQTAQDLVNTVVGPGVTTMNATLNCSGSASGIFWGTSNLGIDTGIVLGTGYANTSGGAVGLNGPASMSVGLGGGAGTDPDLVSMANFYNPSNSGIYNACILEFDFVPKGDTVKFDYVFASEEYNTYACTQFTDFFALLISGPGITPNGPFTNKRNVALVPGTASTPVMINTVNAGNSVNTYCTSIDPAAPYTAYYVNNVNLGGTTVTYNGFTTVFTAEAAVIPCETYHLKFAISNVSDQGFQSAVMIKAGSLVSTNVQSAQVSGEGGNSDKVHTVRGCKPAQLLYQRADCDTMFPFTFHLEIGGDAVNGVDYEFIADTLLVPAGTSMGVVNIKALHAPPTGPRYVTIGIKHPDSVLVGAPIVPIIQRDTVYIYDSLYLDILTPPTTVCPNTPITIEAVAGDGLQHSWNPVNYTGLTITPNMITSRPFTITVSQPDAPPTCMPVSRTYWATVEQYPDISVPKDTVICVADTVAIPVSVFPDSVDYVYQWTPATYMRAGNIGTNFFKAPPGDYYYSLKVSTPVANCSRSENVHIQAVLPERFQTVLPASGTAFNYNEEVNLMAQGNFVFYTWFPTELFVDPYLNVNKIRAREQRDFFVVGIDKYGCRDTAYVNIDIVYPPNPIIPNAFTPNNDGRNDVFRIPGNEFNKVLRFEVYDRWGRRVFHSFDRNAGWDGTDEKTGKACEQGVYQYIFTAEMPNKEVKTYKGDVSLIR